MGENSAIEWTTHTFNPWIGCTKVAPGCAHCYAEVLMDHRYGKAEWGPTGQLGKASQMEPRCGAVWGSCSGVLRIARRCVRGLEGKHSHS
jgi:protein gp37